jgi:hypothetical protein
MATRIRRTRLVVALRRVKRPRLLRLVISALTRPFRAGRVRAARPAGIEPRLERRVPAWSLLVLLLLGVGAGFYASTIFGELAGARASSAPDFTVGSVPGSLSVPQGQIGSFIISMNSLNGFAGSVDLNVSARPGINATFALNPVSVSLFTGSATATLTIPVAASVPVNNYFLTVSAVSGRLVHNVILILQVIPPPLPDFQLQAQQSAINVTQGYSGSTTIKLTSIGGFSGIVNLTSSISLSGGSSPTLTLNPTKVTLLSGGTSTVLITINTTGTTPKGAYSITVQGISGGLSNSANIGLTVQ